MYGTIGSALARTCLHLTDWPLPPGFGFATSVVLRTFLTFHFTTLNYPVSNSFDPIFDINFTFELDSFSTTTPFALRIHITPILTAQFHLNCRSKI